MMDISHIIPTTVQFCDVGNINWSRSSSRELTESIHVHACSLTARWLIFFCNHMCNTHSVRNELFDYCQFHSLQEISWLAKFNGQEILNHCQSAGTWHPRLILRLKGANPWQHRRGSHRHLSRNYTFCCCIGLTSLSTHFRLYQDGACL